MVLLPQATADGSWGGQTGGICLVGTRRHTKKSLRTGPDPISSTSISCQTRLALSPLPMMAQPRFGTSRRRSETFEHSATGMVFTTPDTLQKATGSRHPVTNLSGSGTAMTVDYWSTSKCECSTGIVFSGATTTSSSELNATQSSKSMQPPGQLSQSGRSLVLSTRALPCRHTENS